MGVRIRKLPASEGNLASEFSVCLIHPDAWLCLHRGDSVNGDNESVTNSGNRMIGIPDLG